MRRRHSSLRDYRQDMINDAKAAVGLEPRTEAGNQQNNNDIGLPQ